MAGKVRFGGLGSGAVGFVPFRQISFVMLGCVVLSSVMLCYGRFGSVDYVRLGLVGLSSGKLR